MVRATALALTALTGFSGLVYEVAWQKYVATLLGSHSEATASVLALFLGGLSVGYAVFGRVTRWLVERGVARDEPPRLLLVYGLVEIGIGVHALAFPWLFDGVRSLSLAIPHQVSGLGFALDVSLVALLILPPTILMGGTIPLLTQALSKSLADATRLHALVYAFNTTGAFLGALLAGFVLVPQLGLPVVVLAMGLVNLGAGTCFGLLGLVQRGALGDEEGDPESIVRLGVLAPVALLSGFAAMALQTVLIRVGGLSIGSSEFTFSMIVAVFVLCIAVGSFAVSALTNIPKSLLVIVQVVLVGLLLLLYPVMAETPYWTHVIRSTIRDEAVGFYFYQVALFLVVLVVLAVPIGLSGATLPLIFHMLRREIGGLGSAAGRLYAWNTAGSLLGALLGGYLLLFFLDLDHVYLAAVGAVLLSAGLLAMRTLDRPRLVLLGLAPLVVALFLMPRWDPEKLSSGMFRVRAPVGWTTQGPEQAFEQYRPNSKIVFYDDDPASSVAVYATQNPGEGVLDFAIMTNGKPDGSIRGDYPTMALAGLIPSLFVDQAERAFVIGFGTGVTVGELAALDSIERVAVAEISPGVIEAGQHFETRNQGALASPKTEIIVSDAYRALQGSDEQWDIIVSEPSNPWVAGVEMLFSQEFLEAARAHLRPGGVYAQWFHLYEVDDEVVELVIRTYLTVFDSVAVWYTLGPDVILLGFNDDRDGLDLRRMTERSARPDVAAGLARSGIESLPALLAHELIPVGVLRETVLEGDIHTLLHPVLNHRAAQSFFIGGRGSLPRTVGLEATQIGRTNSLLGQYRLGQGGRLSDADYAEVAGQLCISSAEACATLLALWGIDRPGSTERLAFIDDLPSSGKQGEEVFEKKLQELARLLGAGEPPEGRIDLAEVTRLSNLYASYYHHAAPFDRQVLLDLWRRCKDQQSGVACHENRSSMEERLGPLRARKTARVDP